MIFLEILKAVFLGIVEGITEWLPISSTGHMILVDEFMTLNISEPFKKLFFVVIQLGAILAVPIYFFDRLNPLSKKKSKEENQQTWNLWKRVVVGAIPAGVFGFLLDDVLETYVFTDGVKGYVVIATLILYGIAFIVVENAKKKKGDQNTCRIVRVEDLTYTDALKIGAFQTLSLIPGTSRSGSTILGGMLTGVSREASAEFSFFMAIPVMLGASGLKVLKFLLEGYRATALEIWLLLIGIAVAFVVSLAAIRFLMDFVKRHSFSPFGIYRIVLGTIVLLYFLVR